MTWAPSHETTRYDRVRVARLKPMRDAVDRLRLPRIRARKLGGLFNALEMQIEDGGDSPTVNALLLDALRAGIRHQVDERAAQDALRAIDTFAREEDWRWAQARAGTLPPIELLPEERLDDLMQEGHRFFEAGQLAAACDRWLMAWDMVRQLARPEMRTVSDFDQVYSLFQSVFNWSSDLTYELNNAGIRDSIYYEHQLRFTGEYLALFPAAEPHQVVMIMRARGEALWALGRQAEGEDVYRALVERLPDEGWAYIGWSDEYWLHRRSAPNYATAAAILQRALTRPTMRDRKDVLERLAELHAKGIEPAAQATVAVQQGKTRSGRAGPQSALAALAATPAQLAPLVRKPGRNDPCWCGSGKKYKHCHLNADARAKER